MQVYGVDLRIVDFNLCAPWADEDFLQFYRSALRSRCSYFRYSFPFVSGCRYEMVLPISVIPPPFSRNQPELSSHENLGKRWGT